MCRLTQKDSNGRWYIHDQSIAYDEHRYGKEIDRLAAYEDTGLKPEEIRSLISPPNDPLTLEELREMDGEPVYCVLDADVTVNGEKKKLFHKEEWGIVSLRRPDGEFIICSAFMYKLEGYGKTWLAYRNKPENT